MRTTKQTIERGSVEENNLHRKPFIPLANVLLNFRMFGDGIVAGGIEKPFERQ
jgi:hypothetical protein